MKRYVYVLLSCLLTVTASAQSTLEQKVAKAVKEAPERVSVAMERNLIQYYHNEEVGKVDITLKQQPLLANTHIVGENGQRISMVYDAFLRDDLPMLKVFYKHGAECEQCLKESFTSSTDAKQELTFQYQLPIYMEKHRAQLEPVYKQLTKGIPPMEFPRVSVEFLGRKYTPKTSEEIDAMIEELSAAYYHECETKYWPYGISYDGLMHQCSQADEQLEEIRSHLVEYEDRMRLAKAQPVPAPVEFPQVSVEFLGKTYEPKTSAEVDPMIDNIKSAYQHEVERRLGYGNKNTTELTAQQNQAIARLKQGRSQLVQYEKRMQQRDNIQNTNREIKDAVDKQITQAVKMFNGQVDLVVKFFNRFPKENVFNWSYYSTGTNLMGIDFHIPVLYSAAGAKKWTVYDARPETFGTKMHYKFLGDIKNANDVEKAIAIFAGSSDFPYAIPRKTGEEMSKILAVFHHPAEGLRVIAYKKIWQEEIYDDQYGSVHHVYLLSIAEGQRKIQTLQDLPEDAWPDYPTLGDWKKGKSTVASWKNKLKNEGYTLIWEAK